MKTNWQSLIPTLFKLKTFWVCLLLTGLACVGHYYYGIVPFELAANVWLVSLLSVVVVHEIVSSRAEREITWRIARDAHLDSFISESSKILHDLGASKITRLGAERRALDLITKLSSYRR